MPTSTRVTRLAELDGIAAVGGVLNAAVLQLVKEPFVATPNLAVADIVEADFDGYAEEAALAFDSAYVDSAGRYVIAAPSVNFQASGATTPNVIYGWVILNTAKTAVVAAHLFDDPVPVNVADDGVQVQPEVVWGL